MPAGDPTPFRNALRATWGFLGGLGLRGWAKAALLATFPAAPWVLATVVFFVGPPRGLTGAIAREAPEAVEAVRSIPALAVIPGALVALGLVSLYVHSTAETALTRAMRGGGEGRLRTLAVGARLFAVRVLLLGTLLVALSAVAGVASGGFGADPTVALLDAIPLYGPALAVLLPVAWLVDALTVDAVVGRVLADREDERGVDPPATEEGWGNDPPSGRSPGGTEYWGVEDDEWGTTDGEGSGSWSGANSESGSGSWFGSLFGSGSDAGSGSESGSAGWSTGRWSSDAGGRAGPRGMLAVWGHLWRALSADRETALRVVGVRVLLEAVVGVVTAVAFSVLFWVVTLPLTIAIVVVAFVGEALGGTPGVAVAVILVLVLFLLAELAVVLLTGLVHLPLRSLTRYYVLFAVGGLAPDLDAVPERRRAIRTRREASEGAGITGRFGVGTTDGTETGTADGSDGTVGGSDPGPGDSET